MSRGPIRSALALLAALLAQAGAQAGEMTLYLGENFRGREVTLREVTPNLVELGFNDRSMSMVVRSGRWEVCVDSDFRGTCAVFERGEYRDLKRFDNTISSAREVGTGLDRREWRRQRGPRGMLELFTHKGLEGNSTRLMRDQKDFAQIGFNDRAASMLVSDGTWQLCSGSQFRGLCREFGPGRHADLGFGLTGRVSSARLVQDQNYPDPNAAVLLYQDEGLRGQAIALGGDVDNFAQLDFNDRALSLTIQRGTWEFCVDSHYRGQCRVLGPGDYLRLEGPLARSISSVRLVADSNRPVRSDAEVELFGAPDFAGARLGVAGDVPTLREFGFNDRAASIIVRYGLWEFCVHSDYLGRCVVNGPGRYGGLGSMDKQISSLRRIR